MTEKTNISIIEKLKKDVIPGINLFEAVLFTITTVLGIILLIFSIINKESGGVAQTTITFVDLPLGILAATFLAKRNKLAPLLLAIDAILYGTANFLGAHYALGIVNAIITPILYLIAYFWLWPKQEVDSDNREIKTRKLTPVLAGLLVLGILVISVSFGFILPLIFTDGTSSYSEQWLNEFSIWFDAFASTLMLFAVVASIFRFRENWFLYLTSNIMKIIMFTTILIVEGSADGMLLLMALAYFINATFGILVWNKSEVVKLKKKEN